MFNTAKKTTVALSLEELKKLAATIVEEVVTKVIALTGIKASSEEKTGSEAEKPETETKEETVKEPPQTEQGETTASQSEETHNADESTDNQMITDISAGVKQLLEKVETLIDDERKFNKLHDELDKYRKGLYRSILSPLLKHIVGQYSKVNEQYKHYDRKQSEDGADKAALFDNLLKEYRNLQLSLSDLLNDYDIEIFEPKAGEEFNPKMHRAIKTLPAENTEQDRRIAACASVGFKDISANDLIIKHAEVEIYKLKN